MLPDGCGAGPLIHSLAPKVPGEGFFGNSCRNRANGRVDYPYYAHIPAAVRSDVAVLPGFVPTCLARLSRGPTHMTASRYWAGAFVLSLTGLSASAGVPTEAKERAKAVGQPAAIEVRPAAVNLD